MKKAIMLFAFALIGLFILPSCEGDTDECKDCRIVVYDQNGNVVSEGTPENLCGDELLDIEGSSETIGDKTSVWVCD